MTVISTEEGSEETTKMSAGGSSFEFSNAWSGTEQTTTREEIAAGNSNQKPKKQCKNSRQK